MTTPHSPPRRLAGVSRVWYLTGATIPVVAALAVIVTKLPSPSAPVGVPIVLFAVLFYIAEITVVHVRFRRDAHSFSMSEFPLVLSLFFLRPWQILLFSLIGSALALAINRRQRGVKLAFNLVQLALQTSVVVGVFELLTASADPLGPAGWIGVVAGVTATVIVSNTMISAAIRLSGGTLSREDRSTMYMLSTGAALMNSALALVSATMIWTRPGSGWIGILPPAILYFSYRAYLGQKVERDRLQSLYEMSGELHALPEVENALAAAAERTRLMFDAEHACIVLFPDETGPALLTASNADGETTVMETVDTVDPEISAFVDTPENGELVLDGTRGVGMIVTIPTVVGQGVLAVQTPLSDIGSYGEKDVRLLETLAGHVAVSLKNGHLEESLAQVTELKDELHELTLLDSLTGLANRQRLHQELARAIGERRGRSAVMFIDLDDFKGINDTYGHDTGDQVLVEVGRRLVASCRPHDTVARLGGDEFALLLEHLGGDQDVVPVASRIIQFVSAAIDVDGLELSTRASIGIAMVSPGDAPEDVLRRADEAMYAAKADGKSRYQIHKAGMTKGLPVV